MRWTKKKKLRDMELPDLQKRLAYLQSKYGMKKTNEMKYIQYHIKRHNVQRNKDAVRQV